MNIVTKGAFVIMIAIATQMARADAPKEPVELFRTDGEVSQAESGWTYQAGSDEEMVYIPFEGVYPNKGGRIQSPWFEIPKSDRGAYYRLTFTAKTPEHCYWWLDYRDKDGERVPDNNSEVYPGDTFRDYDEVVYVPSAVRQVQIAFVSKAKVEAKDIRFTTTTAEEAAKWCDDVYSKLPPLKFTPPADAMKLLPRTVAALEDGTPWRVVMLGSSHMNDTFNSLLAAQVQRDFPNSRFNFVPSVRGSTGCSYFRQPEHFQTYVVDKKPDLFIILASGSIEDLASVIEQTQEKVGCEIAVMTHSISRDWREPAGTLDWRSLKRRDGSPAYDNTAKSECAAKHGVAFWDLTPAAYEYRATSGDADLNRDWVHNNDNGKQIIGRLLRRVFLTAKSASDGPNRPTDLFRTDGDVSRADSGWTYQEGSDEEMVYIPFEGVYPNKGGRIQSPWFEIPKSDRGAYYRLTFTVQTPEHCYWWLDYRDGNDESIPDCNSEVFPSEEFRDYDEVMYVPSKTRKVQIAFVSKAKVEAKDIRFTAATVEEAAKWCDQVYGKLPPLKFTALAGSMALLPKTVAALKDGSPWRVVMLGNSHMNDSFNSLIAAQVQRDFPNSRFNFVASVRGRTGCSYYKEPENFAKYVVAKEPDLLIILGRRGSEDVEKVVKMTREQVGCEIVVMSNPLGGDWRERAGTLDWRSIKGRSGGPAYDVTPLRESAAKLGVAFWDMTTPSNDYLAAAGDIDFNRDYTHSNNNGKQIIGRILREYFLTAKSASDGPNRPTELFRTDGDVSRSDSDWTYQAGSDEEMVYIPFEGMYPNKGGRMQSPWFALPDTGGSGAYYRLTFKAKTAEHCYWWLDYRDENDQSIPDCNSEVYVGDEFRDYDEVVYVQNKVRQVQIAFVSKGRVEVKDVLFTSATPAEAAQWCDDLYKTIPPLNFTAPPDSMKLLPKTVAALKDGMPWRVVMLGNSIMNDSFNSLFMALVQRDFPKARFNVIASVRGGTGCGYFRQPDQFKKYVVAHKPDLLIIRTTTGGEDVAEVIKMTREQVGCEVLLISNPLSGDWRERNNTLDWRSLLDQPNYAPFDTGPLHEWAGEQNVPLWDVTVPVNDYLATVGDIDFGRDWVHNNDVGKQIIGRLLHQYFLTAK